MKVALLVQEQKAEAKERERIEQELQVAALIQQTREQLQTLLDA